MLEPRKASIAARSTNPSTFGKSATPKIKSAKMLMKEAHSP